jgi:hypothetical protein
MHASNFFRKGLVASLIWLGLGFTLLAGNPEVATRSLQRTVPLHAGQIVSIANRTGHVKLHTWASTDVQVIVTIRAYAASQSDAQARLERIKILDSVSTTSVSFRTQVDAQKANQFSWMFGGAHSGTDERHEVEYEVYMPAASNRLHITQMYGEIVLPDFSAPIQIDLSYGILKAAKLSNARTLIRLKYATADFAEIHQGKLDASFSGCTIDQLTEVDMDLRYTKMRVHKGGIIRLSAKHGELQVDQIDRLTGTVTYAGFEIGELRKSLAVQARYLTGFHIETIAKGFESIDIKGAYSSYSLNFQENASFTLSSTISYGNLRCKQDFCKIKQLESTQRTTKFEGTGGQASGLTGRVLVEASYGDVRIGRAK